MTNDETLPESDPIPPRDVGEAPPIHALVLAWSRDEPWRLGQALLVPPGHPGPPITFGRGPADPGDTRKALLREHRFFQSNPTPPFASASVSRTQLEVYALGEDCVVVRNLGRCALLRNGVPVAEAEFRCGDTLQLGKQALFFVTKCPSAISGGPLDYPDFAFGEADAQGIVGESAAIWRLRGQIACVASRAGHVLVQGPSGSGKELVAQAIHALSPRRSRRLVARSAATMPETLIDAELFGNCKNYPNPGMPDRQGLVGEANESTLFLDEIAELPHASQAHLLRFLDRGEYHRLGESKSRQADLRLVAATNRDPAALKHDLLGRLTLRVAVPALDDRLEDVPLLVRHILTSAAARGDTLARTRLETATATREPPISIDLTRKLLLSRYQVGMRELETVLWHHLTTPEVSASNERDLAPVRRENVPQDHDVEQHSANDSEATDLTAARIQRCLDDNNGVVELTWRALGMKNRFVLIRAIKKYGLEIRRRPGRGPLRFGGG